MPVLSCRRLTRRPWFQECDLDLESGELVVLRAPSGSGKTLLLRALAELDPVDGGRVELDGQDRRELPPHRWRRRVVYVDQRRPSLPGTVAEDLESIASLQPHAATSLDDAHVEAALGSVDKSADTGHLSGGEAARLALARAFVTDPRVLLLDEIEASLDTPAARELEVLILDWLGSTPGRAVLWASHDDDLARRCGTRTWNLNA